MKLIQHTLKIRALITQALSNRMERMGLKHKDFGEPMPELAEERRKVEAVVNDHRAEGKSYADARTEALNEYVFTLFNRIAAIKVMETRGIFPEVIRQRTENSGRSFAHNQWLEEHPDMRYAEREGLLEMLQSKFDELGEKLPIYRSDYPYSMMPTADELHEIIVAFNAIDEDNECDKNWKDDDILGWLYENFNAVEKEALKTSGDKIEYDKVSLQSQVYTPQWVVKFLVDNTLMKMYLEMYPDSKLRNKYKVANAPTERIREPKDVLKIKLIDPAQGGGNFLVYALEVFYDIYKDQIESYGIEYVKRKDIPKLILEYNIYGVDIDRRATQLTQLSLFIKAWQLGGKKTEFPEHLNIVSTNFVLPDWNEIELVVQMGCEWDSQELKILEKAWQELKDAPKFGSLIRVEETLDELKPIDEYNLFAKEEKAHRNIFDFKQNAIEKLREQLNRIENSPYSMSKVNDAMTFLEILINKFDVAVANPPYTDSADFGSDLKTFIDENYRQPVKFNTNLYAAFIKRVCELTDKDGKVGLIHPHTFMFIKTFEDVRKYMIEKTHINVMVDYGLDRVNLFGPGILVDSTFYTLDKGEINKNETGVYFNITGNQQEKFKKGSLLQAYADLCNGIENERVYRLPQTKLKEIKSWPFIYWISDDFRKKFSAFSLDKVAKVISGMKTGKNEGALRLWWEVESENWTPYTKGGEYNKWYGNNWLKVRSDNDFEYIKGQKSWSIPSITFKVGITYNGSGSKGITYRLLEEDTLYDMGASSIFSNYTWMLIGLLNSKLLFYCTECLNPTVNKQPGDVKRLPLVDFKHLKESYTESISELSQICVVLKKHLCQYSLIEPLFKNSPILKGEMPQKSLETFYVTEIGLLSHILINEAIINEKVFEIYELTEHDKQMVLDKEGVPVGSLPVSEAAKEAYLEWGEQQGEFKPLPEAKAYIEALPIDNDQERIKDFDILYQAHNDWEEFCIRHNMNPIESWYQFRNSKVLPPQRTQELAFELVTDVIRSALAKDDDGITPLVQRAGEEHLAPRIEAELVERGYSSEAISQVFALLGMPLDKYLMTKFFQQLSDRLNLFMYLPKTPFIWHISSGPFHALEVYISIYRWDRDKLFRIKSVYASNRESGLRDQLAVLEQKTDSASREKAEEIKAQLAELKQFCEKIDDLLASGYNPKLDDGVGKNIAPLQKRKMLAYEVLNLGQLKKYLNADW